MRSTLEIFRRLYNDLPPLFPDDLKQKMHHALNHLENDPTVTLEAAENTMIVFGYEVWPWNQAYREWLALAETKVGEHFLLPKLSPPLQKKYEDFKHFGGSFRELHSGNPAEWFSAEERVELCGALVDTREELKVYVSRELMGMEKQKYLKRVEEFRILLQDIKKILNELRVLADSEQDHPTLAAEIRAKIQGFEFSLCLLGPELDCEAVCQSVDFFAGRKCDLNRLQGINNPLRIDFFAE